MNIAQLYAELEEDRNWREEEIRAFQNQGAKLESEDEQKRHRRAVVLLIYAHFEGFCKFALMLYVSAVNKLGMPCSKANYALVAATLADVFRDLRNPDKKSILFSRVLPDDTKLHRFAREREFVEKSSEFEKLPLRIADDVVDTESNLTPTVLRKNLYRLGLPHDKFDSYKDEINKLLGVRNAISHGSLKDGLDKKLYSQLRSSTYSIMSGVSTDVMKALYDAAYARP